MISRPLPSAQLNFRRSLRSSQPDVLDEVREALALGATPNDSVAQALWLKAPSLWSDKPLAESLKAAGLKACQGLPLKEAVTANSWTKLELLMDCGLNPSELGAVLLMHPDRLVEPGQLLLERCLEGGFVPTQQQVWFATLETEDASRALLLASHKHLDVNAPSPMEDRGHPLTVVQAMMLFSRQVWLDEWLDAGADFTSPLASGFLPATRLMLDVNTNFSLSSPPIPTSRAQFLLGLAQRNLVDWLACDAFGVQPIQALRALPASEARLWRKLESVAERQSMACKMEISLPATPPSHPRARL